MAKKLKFKLLGEDPVYRDVVYICKLCKGKMTEELLEDHAHHHKRNTYMIEIDIKKDKTDGKGIFRVL